MYCLRGNEGLLTQSRKMLDVIHLLIPGLTGIYTAFHLYARATSPKQSKVSNPNFNVFQRSYLIPYLLATLADWFQAPYLYKLYHYYGFLEQQIAVIYVVGFISTVIASTLASTLVHKAKRKQFVLGQSSHIEEKLLDLIFESEKIIVWI